jgi:hypothetical protein
LSKADEFSVFVVVAFADKVDSWYKSFYASFYLLNRHPVEFGCGSGHIRTLHVEPFVIFYQYEFGFFGLVKFYHKK